MGSPRIDVRPTAVHYIRIREVPVIDEWGDPVTTSFEHMPACGRRLKPHFKLTHLLSEVTLPQVPATSAGAP